MACAQYPAEKEITFPPFTCLESDGEPRVEWTKDGETVLFPLKVIPRMHPPISLPQARNMPACSRGVAGPFRL